MAGIRIPSPKDLRKLRIKAGLTQKELARRAGVSQSLIARIEKGDINPRLSTLQKILEVINEALEESEDITKIMHSPVITLKPDDLVEKAVKLMDRYGISQIPVVDDQGKIIGTVIDTTLLKRVLEEKSEVLFKRKVSEVMDPPLPTLPPSTKISTVSLLLFEYPAVLIVDKGKIIGIITKIDLIKAKAQS